MMRSTWVLEIMDCSQFTFYPFFVLAIRFLEEKNDINIDKNLHTFLGSFFTLYIL